jgi:hypothetical protein
MSLMLTDALRSPFETTFGMCFFSVARAELTSSFEHFVDADTPRAGD